MADSGGHCTKMQLAKLTFLLAREGRSDQLKTFYEFVPYLYGPYSFTLNHELDNLVRSGLLLLPTDEKLELTKEGQKAVGSKLDARLLRDLELLEKNYGKLDQNSLVDEVYKKYPWFTLNSANKRKRNATQVEAPCANYTIGYQGFQVDGLLNKLLETGIKTLVDTRSNPISRRYGYHKSTLQKLCQKVGVKYEHLPELGIPSDWRQDLENELAYSVLFERYEESVLGTQTQVIAKLSERVTTAPTAFLCRESNPSECHRSRLAGALRKLNGLPIVDIGV